MNVKLIATAVLFSCTIVACSKQDEKPTTKTKNEVQAKAPKDCKTIKDEDARSKCVADQLFKFTPDHKTISTPAKEY
jgi:hypothetical protein